MGAIKGFRPIYPGAEEAEGSDAAGAFEASGVCLAQ